MKMSFLIYKVRKASMVIQFTIQELVIFLLCAVGITAGVILIPTLIKIKKAASAFGSLLETNKGSINEAIQTMPLIFENVGQISSDVREASDLLKVSVPVILQDVEDITDTAKGHIQNVAGSASRSDALNIMAYVSEYRLNENQFMRSMDHNKLNRKEAISMLRATSIVLGLAFLALGILGITSVVPMFKAEQIFVNIGEIVIGALGMVAGMFARDRRENYHQQKKANEQQSKANDQQRKENINQQQKVNDQQSKENEHQQKANDQQSKENEQQQKANDQQKKENEQQRRENQHTKAS
jgi:hypothetical protein